MNKILKAISALTVAGVVSGCAAIGETDFSCGRPGKGVGCLPSSEVYELTNEPKLYEEAMRELEAAAASGEEYNPYDVIAEVRARYQPTTEVVKTMAEPISQPLPVLKPAHVIRIWFDAWVDQKGDLHMPGYVFTEITPRRWSFGEPEVSSSEILAPVQVDRNAAGNSPQGLNQ